MLQYLRYRTNVLYHLMTTIYFPDTHYENALFPHSNQESLKNSVTRRVMLPPPNIYQVNLRTAK